MKCSTLIFLFFLYLIESEALVRPEPVTFVFEKQFGSNPYFLQRKCDIKKAIAVSSAARDLYKEKVKVDEIIKEKVTEKTTTKELKDLTEEYCDKNEKIVPLSQKLVDTAEYCLNNAMDDARKQEIVGIFIKTICETTFAEFNWDIIWKEKFDRIHELSRDNQGLNSNNRAATLF